MTWTTHTDHTCLAARSVRAAAACRVTGALILFALTLGVAPLTVAQPAGPDSDGDRLTDADETGIYRTDPAVFDTDGDGSCDGEEVSVGTDPLTANAAMERVDTDSDGLFDDDEVNVYGTNPNNPDTDEDGRPDGPEVAEGTDPLVKNITTLHIEGQPGPAPVDSDGDGLDDGAEATYGTDPARIDTDGDGLKDGEEVTTFGTSPTMRDTDGNGYTDWEDVTALAARTTDSDGDGVSDADEFNRGTDPYTPNYPDMGESAAEEGEDPGTGDGQPAGDDWGADPCHPPDGHPNDLCMEEGETHTN